MADLTYYTFAVLLLTISCHLVRLEPLDGAANERPIAPLNHNNLQLAYMGAKKALDELRGVLQQSRGVIYAILKITIPGGQINGATVRMLYNKMGRLKREWQMMRWLKKPMSPRRFAAQQRRKLAAQALILRPHKEVIKTKSISMTIGYKTKGHRDNAMEAAEDECSIMDPAEATLRSTAKQIIEKEQNKEQIIGGGQNKEQIVKNNGTDALELQLETTN